MLDIGDLDIVVAPVTSQARSNAGDISVVEFKSSGLLRPSWVRLAKVATLLKSDIVRALGRLSLVERNQLAQTWKKLYDDFAS